MPATVTGVDIGATALRAVRLVLRDGQLELAAAAALDLPSPAPAPAGAGSGAPAPAEGPADPERDIRTSLASLLRRGGLRSRRSVLGLGGQGALVRYLQVPPVPPWKLEMMMKYEVQEQPSASENSAYDYRLLDLPDVGGQITVLLAQVQEKRLLARLDSAARAGLSDPDVDLNTLGLFNAYVHCHGPEPDRTVLLVDVGAETVGLAVARGSALCFARSMPGGGARFTAAVAEELHLSPAEAESLKREKGEILSPERAERPSGNGAASSGEGPAEIIVIVPSGEALLPEGADEGRVSEVGRRLSEVLDREAAALAGVIDSSLMYCRAQTKQAKLRPDEVLLTGGGSMLRGLPEALARRLRMRVGRLEPFRKVSLGSLPASEVEGISGQAPRYAMALGLAASRLSAGAARLSLVTEAAKARRSFLEHGIFMWYAAAAVLVIAATLVWVPLRNRNILANEMNSRQKLLEEARRDSAAFEALYAETVQRRDEVEALRERDRSGEDIYGVLDLLRRRTDGRFQSIVLLEASNRPPHPLSTTDEDAQLSFQKARRVFIRGYTSMRVPAGGGKAAADKAEAEMKLLVKDYYKELERPDPAKDIVASVVPRVLATDAEALRDDELRVQFVLQINLRSGEVAEAPAAAARPKNKASAGGQGR